MKIVIITGALFVAIMKMETSVSFVMQLLHVKVKDNVCQQIFSLLTTTNAIWIAASRLI